MKISDEQIEVIFKKHGYSLNQSARELIALAQEVKPLELVPLPSGIKQAHTQFGAYSFCAYIDEVRMLLPEEANYYDKGYKTEAEAIEAANADYRKRVLSCLVNGGV
jgi:hypothetical protein